MSNDLALHYGLMDLQEIMERGARAFADLAETVDWPKVRKQARRRQIDHLRVQRALRVRDRRAKRQHR